MRRNGINRQWWRAVAASIAGIALLSASPPALAHAVERGPDLPPLFTSVGDTISVPDGVVSSLAQDGDGLLWIGTTGGLVRYDGQRLRTYRHDPADEHSLPGNVVSTLLRALDGRIWVGVERGGVAVYDPVEGRFQRFGPEAGVPATPVRALAEDVDGAIWIGGNGGGLARLDPERGRASVLLHDPEVPGSLPDNRVSALYIDRRGTLWVATWRGLARRFAGSRQFEPVLSAPGDPLGFSQALVRSIVKASSGDLWVGAQQGQVAVIPAALLGRAEVPRVDEVKRWQGDGMTSAAEARPGEIWLAQASGIEIRALDGAHPLGSIRPVVGEPFGLVAAELRALLVDHSGLLWVGSIGGGVQFTDPRDRGLVNRRLIHQVDPPLPALNVLTMGEALDGGAWLGLAGAGVARLTPALHIRDLVTPEQGGFSGNQPAGVAESPDRALWLATEQGLYRRPPGKTRFDRIEPGGFPEAASVRRLWPDATAGLWVGTADGLFHVGQGGSPVRRLVLPGGGTGGTIEAMARDRGGRWWVAGSEGLMRLDPTETALQQVPTVQNGIERRLDIDGLLVDRQGQFWIDASGLYRVKPQPDGRAQVEPVSAALTLGSNSFGANLLEDGQGRIWTQRWMYDPDSGSIEMLDGARVGTGWFRSFARMPHGRLAFGAREGVLVVDTARYRREIRLPQVVISEVRIDGKRAAVGPAARRITLERGQRNVSIEFSLLDAAAPALHRYRYRLHGVDADWVEMRDDARVAVYGNLWPGSYRFEVQAKRQGGEWNPDSRVLEVVVETLWWQTHLAAIAALLAMMALGSLILRWRTHALRASGQRLEREVERRTSELRELSEELARKTREFEEASLTDPLTGLRNRRFLASALDAEMALASRRHGEAAPRRDVVVLIVDIDFFKAVNDQHGHAGGDELLRQIADRLRRLVRAGDDVVRWGGEEFLIVARGVRNALAEDLAERIRIEVSGLPYALPSGEVSVTCSIGFAPLPWDPTQPTAVPWEGVVTLADTAMYTVKRGGRNGWLGLYPTSPLPPEADLGWLLQQLRPLVASGGLRLVSNHDPERMEPLLASRAH